MNSKRTAGNSFFIWGIKFKKVKAKVIIM